MGLKKMKKVVVFVPKGMERRALEELQCLGVFHIGKVGEEICPVSGTSEQCEILERIPVEKVCDLVSFLDSRIPARRDFLETFVTLRRCKKICRTEFQKMAMVGEERFWEVKEETEVLNARKQKLLDKKSSLLSQLETIESVSGTSYSLEELAEITLGSGKLCYALGMVKEKSLAREHDDIAVEDIGFDKRSKERIVLVAASEMQKIGRLGIKLMQPTANWRNGAKSVRKEVEGEISGVEAEMAGIEDKIDLLNKEWGETFRMLAEKLKLDAEMSEAHGKLGRGALLVAISGWVEEENAKLLEQRLVERLKSVSVIIEDPKPQDRVPVVMDNGLAKPFETITRAFSTPSYSELDPTPFLAPFFLLFFGMCLTDAGYGIMLAIGGLLLSMRYEQYRSFFRLLSLVGVSTFFVGALMGSWFGSTWVGWYSGIIPNASGIIAFHELMAGPINFMMLALSLGLVQLVSGTLLSMVNGIRRGRVLEAVLDKGPWLLFFAFLICLLISHVIPIGVGPDILGNLIILSLLLLVLTQGRSQKNVFMKLAAGVASLYGIVGYMSDVLSYSRLLALGMATGIIGMIINLLAQIAMDKIPYVGFFVAVFVLVFGHLINLLLNSFGAYIHSARLQYVEFFTKFFDGGGVKFRPLGGGVEYKITEG